MGSVFLMSIRATSLIASIGSLPLMTRAFQDWEWGYISRRISYSGTVGTYGWKALRAKEQHFLSLFPLLNRNKLRDEVYSAAVLVSRKAVLCYFLHKLSQHDQYSWLYGVRKREGGSIRVSATSPT